jgi:glycosyltransferase involved in cell wall biosynthesis
VDLTVVVHVTGGPERALACFEGLARTITGIDYEVVVVDDATGEATGAVLSCLEGDVVVLRSERPAGFWAAARRAAALARGDVVVFCRTDTVVLDGWLGPLLDRLEKPGVGAVQPRILVPDGLLRDAGGWISPEGVAWLRGRHSPCPADPAFAARDPDFLTTACVAVRRSALEGGAVLSHGIPDGIYADAAFSLALRRDGWSLGCTESPGATWWGDGPSLTGRERFLVLFAEDLADRRPPARPMSVAFYLPQFHPIPENDRFWGPGFTEWRNVARARPAFEGHEQPHLPADLGFYDLRLAEVRAQQAELARNYGVDAFCWYHYWFEGRRLLHRPLDEMLASGEPDFPFLLCWANEDWRARWDGRSGEVLVHQTYSEADDRAHIEWLCGVFADPRYVRIDGKPVFLIYRAAQLPDARRTLALWREVARRRGIGELYLCRVESFDDELDDPRALGFDASVAFAPDWREIGAPCGMAGPHAVHDYAALAARMLAKPEVPWRRIPCVTPRWDNTPRRPDGALIFAGATPERYEGWLATVAEREIARSRSAPMVFVNAWNEWGEGAHLEPCLRWGHAFGEAHRTGIGVGPSAPPSVAAEAVARNAERLTSLAAAAQEAADAGELRRAMALAQAAAEASWYGHPGQFASPALERLLTDIGRRIGCAASSERRRRGPIRRVLHVLTEAHTQGGHTRLVWRWIGADHRRHHEVALTGQGGRPVPGPLTSAAAAVWDLDACAPDGLDHKAAALRALAARFDAVVLHTHPFDAVAPVALAGGRPPTAVCNHAGHVFWLGVGVADVVVCLRTSTARLAATRRGVEASRLVVLPLPLEVPQRSKSRPEAKRALGLDPDDVVLCTIASPYKYVAGCDVGFLELVVPALARLPEAVLVAVGPEPVGEWSAAAAALRGRVRAIGRHDDLRLVREAADVYLDAYPVASPTSYLESAAYGIPVLSFQPAPLVGTPLVADDVGLTDALLVASTLSEYRRLLARLVTDEPWRREIGEASATGVRAAHTGEDWTRRLESVYELLCSTPPAGPPRSAADLGEAGTLDERLVVVHERAGMAAPLEEILARHLGACTPAG